MKFEKLKFINIYIPILLFLTALIWKLFYIGARDICIDEPFTIFHAQLSVIDILQLPTKNEPNPPLFMLLLHFWIKLFGISPFSVRILPILFSTLTAVFLYLTGKRFFGFWSGIIASGMFILSTQHFYFGGDTRTYSMLSMATAAALYYLFSLIENPEKKKYFVALIISNFILVYSHYFGWLTVFIEVLISIFYIQNRKVIIKTWLAVFITILLYIPMFQIMISQFFISKESTWVTPPPAYEYVRQLEAFLNSKKVFRILIYLLGSGIILAFITKTGKEKIKELIMLLLWWLVPYTFMFLISYKIPMFTDRYVLFNSIGLYLFIGAAIGFLFQKIRFLIPLISAGILILMFQYMHTNDYAPRKVKMAAKYVHEKQDNPSEVIIYAHWADLGFIYYYDPELFKRVNSYEKELEENHIYRSWGFEDTKQYLERKNPHQVIFYQDNTMSMDPGNTIFNYLETNYERTDSAHFVDGIIVSVFANKEKQE